MVYDVIIIGSGPAGCTAAIYIARANLKTLVIAGEKWGGQLMLTTLVENFPGFPEGIEGPELMRGMREQAEKFGAEIVEKNALKLETRKRPFEVFINDLSNGANLANKTSLAQGRAVIIATGADTVWLGLPSEQRLIGRGVSSCAPCDAFFFKDKKVAVVGGGDAAMEEALVLAKFAREVKIIHRRDAFRASKIMQKRVFENPKINVVWDTVVEEVLGNDKVEALKLKNLKLLKNYEEEFDGVFVAIGHRPNTMFLEGTGIERDEKGYLETRTVIDETTDLIRYTTASAVPGVFISGDVVDYHYRQAITAAGFGCQAAMDVEKYLEENK